jgi:Tfp pilus assembly protein PilO
MFKNIPENIKLMLRSTLPLFVVIILFVMVAKFGFGKISGLRQEIARSQKDSVILSQKLDLLRTVAETVSTGSQVAIVTLPATNPSLTVSSQLKNLAFQNSVVITNLKSGSEVQDPSGLSRVNVSFDVIGGRTQIIGFIKSIEKIAPITMVDKIKLTESSAETRANVSVKSFWAPLPTKLPALTDQISDLTPDELNTLNEISKFIQPTFTEVPASETEGKADPFK